MKTASEVLDRIDQAIDEMQRAAAGPCIDALIEWSDREAYRDAMRKAHGLKAVQALRTLLAGEIERPVPSTEPQETSTRRGSRKKSRRSDELVTA